MEIRDMMYFCRVAEIEHVSKAAEKLGTSQPFLSKIISQIENELGVELFDHLGRGIKLNEYGKIFYQRAKKILIDLDSIFEEFDNLLEKKNKNIRFMSDTSAFTSDITLQFKRQFPNSLFSVAHAKRNDIIDALSSNKVDFVICSPPISSNELKYVETEIIYRDRAFVLLPPNHDLLTRDTLTINDLKDLPIVTSPKGAGMRNNLDRLTELAGFTPNVVCESMNMQLLINAVLGGVGVTILPQTTVERSIYRKYAVELKFEGVFGEIGLSYKKGLAKSYRLEEFKIFIRDYFNKLKL